MVTDERRRWALERLSDQWAADCTYVTERCMLDIQQQLQAIMQVTGLKQRDLADRLGVHPSRVSQFFHSTGQVTLLTIVAYALALGVQPVIRFAARGEDWSHER